MKRLSVFVLFVLPFLAPALYAQSPRMFTVSSGLISSQVDGVFQDGENSIWITSGYGLTRYDGSNFEHFYHIEDNPFSLSSNNAHFILEDSRGTVWVGTEHGLDIYDPDHNSFSEVPLVVSDPDVTWLIEGNVSENGSRIYCNVLLSGIYVIDSETHKPDSVLTDAVNGVLGTGRGPLLLDSHGILWKERNGEGLKAFDTASAREVPVIWDGASEPYRMRFGAASIVEDPVNSDLYVATHDNGIFRLDRQSMTLSRLEGSDGVGLIESINMKTQNAGVFSRRLYVGTEDHGLEVFDLETGTYIKDGTERFPYCSDNIKIHDIFFDHQGNMWLAAYYSGVVLIPESLNGFQNYKLSAGMHMGVNDAPITSVVENQSDGKIYVASDGAGIFRMESTGVYTPINRSNSGLSNDSVKELIVDRRGKMWVGTYLGGLLTYTSDEGFRPFRGGRDIPSVRVWAMVYDPGSDILYVSTLGGGLYLVDTRQETVVGSVPEMARRWARTLFLDSYGKLWIGTDEGVVYFDPTVRQAMDYDVYGPWEGRPVYAFCESKDGTLWIGYRLGVVELDRSSHNVRTWTETDGMHCQVVKDILAGPDGDIWVSTLNGLSKLDPKTGKIINFHEYDGLPGNEFYSGSAYKTSDNHMYFGAMDGLASFYPHLVNMKSHRLSGVHLSNLTMSNSPVVYDPVLGKKNLLDAHVYRAGRILVPRGCRVVSFGFSTPEYSDPMRVRYGCLMTRCDQEWRAADNSTMVSYTNLRPGRHKLRMRAYFEGDEESYAYSETDVRVRAPWYLSAWAFLIYLAFLSLIVSALLTRRKRRLKAERDTMRLDMFSNITHEIRTPLFLVMSPLKKLREAEKDASLKDTYNLMYRNALRVNRIVNQIMDLRKVDEGEMHLHFQNTDVIYFIRDIMKSFDNLARSKGVSFTLSSADQERYLWIDHGNFDKIIFNILSNAFKFTPDGGRIDISVSSDNGFTEIAIHNTGSHIVEKDIKKVFGRFYQSSNSANLEGSGVGLSLTSQLVELHHGSIRAVNTEDGVSFIVVIPEGKEHLTKEELSPTNHHKDLYTKSPEMSVENESAAAVINAGEEGASARETKGMKRIVIVDDDQDTRLFISKTFNDYNVDAFGNGDDAWSDITTSKVDAVITDLHMPGMDGYALCRKIRRNPMTSHIPLIVLTSVDDEGSEQLCSDLGADRYFVKPVSTDLLRSGVAQAISARESIRLKLMNADAHDYAAVKVMPYDEKLKARILQAINERYSDPDFGVEELSLAVGISRVHLNRKLKAIMGVSPSVLLKNTRLKQAAFLLVDNSQPNVSEIAYKVGFSAQSYFSVAFHEYFGMTPTEFAFHYGGNREKVEHLFE